MNAPKDPTTDAAASSAVDSDTVPAGGAGVPAAAPGSVDVGAEIAQAVAALGADAAEKVDALIVENDGRLQ